MKRTILTCVIRLIVLFATTGCGDSTTETETVNEERYLAIEISGTNGSARITEARYITMPEDVPAVPSLSGDLMLVSYRGSVVGQALPFRLPTFAHVEMRGTRGVEGEQVALDHDASITLFLDARESLERIEVRDEEGRTLANLDSTELQDLTAATAFTPFRFNASVPSPEPRALAAEFPHIRFLDPEIGDELPLAYDLPGGSADELVPLAPRFTDPLRAALRRVPKPALSAIRSLGIARFETNAPTVGISIGSSMILNSVILTDKNFLAEIVVHEATHNYQFLIDNDLNTRLWNPDAWPEDIKQAAEATIAEHRLSAGLTTAWAELHDSGVDLELAAPYREDWQELDDSTAVEGGFASAYGASAPGEDMAEYVARLVVPESNGRSDVCTNIKSADDPFPSTLAITYAKVKFLEALALLDDVAVEECIGDPTISGPEGIHLGQDISLESGLNGGWLDQDGAHFLGVAGESSAYSVLLRVLAPDEQPLGVHRLDDIGLWNLNAPNNALYLAHDDEPLRARVSASGLVLVTTVSPTLIEGAIFMLSLHNAAGLVTDQFAISTFAIPSE